MKAVFSSPFGTNIGLDETTFQYQQMIKYWKNAENGGGPLIYEVSTPKVSMIKTHFGSILENVQSYNYYHLKQVKPYDLDYVELQFDAQILTTILHNQELLDELSKPNQINCCFLSNEVTKILHGFVRVYYYLTKPNSKVVNNVFEGFLK